MREEIAQELFHEDWDEENGFACNNASNGYWEEQDDYLKSHYYRRTDKLLSLIQKRIEEKLTAIGDSELFNLPVNENGEPLGVEKELDWTWHIALEGQLQHNLEEIREVLKMSKITDLIETAEWRADRGNAPDTEYAKLVYFLRAMDALCDQLVVLNTKIELILVEL